MKKPILFQIQLIIVSIAYNEAFMSSSRIIGKAGRSFAPNTLHVEPNGGNGEQNEHTNGFKTALDDSLDETDRESTEISSVNDEVEIDPTETEEETHLDNNDEEEVEYTISETDEIKLDKVSTKEDLLANTSSAASSMSITRSDELMDIIGEDFLKVNSSQPYFESSPPLSFSKYLTMQDKRVPIVIRYSEVPGLRPYFLTTAKKIKEFNPDVIVEKFPIPMLEDSKSDDTTFEVVVDNRVIVGKPQCKWQGVSRGNKDNDNTNNRVFGMSVYINMENVNEAIAKARRKRRPNTAYAQQGPTAKAVGLEILKGGDGTRSGISTKSISE